MIEKREGGRERRGRGGERERQGDEGQDGRNTVCVEQLNNVTRRK